LKKVTVIIATLNRPTLRDTLISLKKQNTQIKVLYVTSNYFFQSVSLLHKSILGEIDFEVLISEGTLYECLNLGLDKVETKYVSFAHDDDWLGSNFFDQAINLMNQNSDINWCFGDVFQVEDNGQLLHLHSDPYYFIGMEFGPPRIWHPAAIYRKDLFKKIGKYRTNIGGVEFLIASDYDWFLRANQLGIKGTKINELQYFMRFGGLSTTRHELSLLECLTSATDLYPNSGLGKYREFFTKNVFYIDFFLKFDPFIPIFIRRLFLTKFIALLRKKLS
jgi:glycosyltransferase involved in cell wall biosynthesis